MIKKLTKKKIIKNKKPILKTKQNDIPDINNINYNIFSTKELFLWLDKYKKYKTSFENLFRMHRNEKCKIKDLDKETKNNPYYQLGYNNNEIITISRLYNNGYIDLVHTNMKYRGLKMCQKSLEKLITNTQFKKIKQFNLLVKKNNIPAIKCYENLGFNIISQIKNCNFMELKK